MNPLPPVTRTISLISMASKSTDRRGKNEREASEGKEEQKATERRVDVSAKAEWKEGKNLQ